MNEMIDLILKRRSVRAYRPEPIADEELSAIVEAGRHAPSGGNNQTTHFIVIRDAKALKALTDLVQESMAKIEIDDNTYPSLAGAVLRAREGKLNFIYGAKTLVITANKKGYSNAMADCACALENMMLAAASLSIGSCWINQLTWLKDDPTVGVALRELGVNDEEWVCGALALGYPLTDPGPALPRTGNPVDYV